MRDGLLIQKLKAESPELFANYEQNVSVLRFALQSYKKTFPYASDYSIVHSLEIVETCDMLIGEENIKFLEADECYCLLMACFLQYLGYGISERTYKELLAEINIDTEYDHDMRKTVQNNVAAFSACIIDKYGKVFEFPTDAHKSSIIKLVQANNGEYYIDETKYADISFPDGKNMHMTYLAAILKLAESLSELTNRNVDLSDSMFSSYSEVEIMDMIERLAVAEIHYYYDELIVGIKGSATVSELIKRRVIEVQKMIDLCARTIDERTNFTLELRKVRLQRANADYDKLYLNKEIEDSWDEEDKEFFAKFSEDEKLYYLKYLSAEYGITSKMKEFSAERGTKLVALEFRVKSPKSVYNKLHLRATTESMLTLGDTIRYTAIFPPKEYTQMAKDMLKELEKEGWYVNILRNAWLEPGFPYNGINVKLKNEDGFRAELQFHTDESYEVKMSPEDHELYEKRRMYDPDSIMYKEILAQQFELYSHMEVPADIETLPNDYKGD